MPWKKTKNLEKSLKAWKLIKGGLLSDIARKQRDKEQTEVALIFHETRFCAAVTLAWAGAVFCSCGARCTAIFDGPSLQMMITVCIKICSLALGGLAVGCSPAEVLKDELCGLRLAGAGLSWKSCSYRPRLPWTVGVGGGGWGGGEKGNEMEPVWELITDNRSLRKTNKRHKENQLSKVQNDIVNINFILKTSENNFSTWYN